MTGPFQRMDGDDLALLLFVGMLLSFLVLICAFDGCSKADAYKACLQTYSPLDCASVKP